MARLGTVCTRSYKLPPRLNLYAVEVGITGMGNLPQFAWPQRSLPPPTTLHRSILQGTRLLGTDVDLATINIFQHVHPGHLLRVCIARKGWNGQVLRFQLNLAPPE